MLTWVRIPTLLPREGWGFVEYARRHGDFAIAGAAAVVGLRPDGTVERVRAGLLNVGDRPLLVSGGASMSGCRPDDELWRDLAGEWVRQANPPENADYVRDVARAALTRALRAAYDRAVSAGGE
nr:hypothetical protein [Planosporangium thailandense]